MARLTEFPSVTIDALGADSYETSCHLSIEPIERLSGSRRDALVELSELLGPDDHVLLCCHNEGEHERLHELIKETDASHSTDLASRIRLTTGRLRRGFRLIDHGLIVISDNELFPAQQLVRRLAKSAQIRERSTLSWICGTAIWSCMWRTASRSIAAWQRWKTAASRKNTCCWNFVTASSSMCRCR